MESPTGTFSLLIFLLLTEHKPVLLDHMPPSRSPPCPAHSSTTESPAPGKGAPDHSGLPSSEGPRSGGAGGAGSSTAGCRGGTPCARQDPGPQPRSLVSASSPGLRATRLRKQREKGGVAARPSGSEPGSEPRKGRPVSDRPPPAWGWPRPTGPRRMQADNSPSQCSKSFM